MTESEWLASADPEAMLTVLTRDRRVEPSEHGRTASDRKLRLFACACVRQVWHLLTDERSRRAVEVAERFADGEATAQELVAVSDAANAAWTAAWTAARDAWTAAWVAANAACAVSDAACAAANAANAAAWDAARKQQAALLRDIAGNPFRPVTISPQWLTPTVLSLAQAAYEERNADGSLDPLRLAILADALEEAGCPAEMPCEECAQFSRQHEWEFRACHGLSSIGPPHPLLSHLRSPGPHYRGLWSLDLILGKE